MSEATEEIDWSVFDGMPEMTCRCRCVDFPGFEYRSYTKLIERRGCWVLVAQKACPECGRNDNLRSSESDPERWSVSPVSKT